MISQAKSYVFVLLHGFIANRFTMSRLSRKDANQIICVTWSARQTLTNRSIKGLLAKRGDQMLDSSLSYSRTQLKYELK